MDPLMHRHTEGKEAALDSVYIHVCVNERD